MRKYESVEIEVIVIDQLDVICTSGGGDPYKSEPDDWQ